MAIIVNLDMELAKKDDLDGTIEEVDITLSNLSILKTGKQRLFVLTPSIESEALKCQPGDLLEYQED